MQTTSDKKVNVFLARKFLVRKSEKQTLVAWLKLTINLAKYPNQRPDSPSQAFSFCFIQIYYEFNLWTQSVYRNKGADRSVESEAIQHNL